MSKAQEYAEIITKRYGVSLSDKKLSDNDYQTIGQVARAVLPKDKLKLWYDEIVVEVNYLREKYNITDGKPLPSFEEFERG